MTTAAREVIDRVDEALQRANTGAFVVGLVRLDRLAEINELIGYECAGLLLDEFETRMRSLARKQDTLIPMDRHTMLLVLRGLADSEHCSGSSSRRSRY